MEPIYSIVNRPKALFKFYSNDSKLNRKRLSGEVYLASPLEFNDPCDCQRGVKNNAPEMAAAKGEAWVTSKVLELGYTLEEAQSLSQRLIKSDESALDIVHNKQLEKSGVLCMSCGYADSVMWGYYTNNQGFCVEYDVEKLIPGLIVGYVNNLDYLLTSYLFEEKKYKQDPVQRNPGLKGDLMDSCNLFFNKLTLNKVSNSFLIEKSEAEILNFIRNVFFKRFVAQSIVYGVKPNVSPSNLFFDGKKEEADLKYFRKTNMWSHEKEFRFYFSLGGRQVIKLGPDVVKNIYFGCNMSDEAVASFVFTIASLGLNSVTLYKMKRLKNGGLQRRKLDLKRYYPDFVEIGKMLDLE